MQHRQSAGTDHMLGDAKNQIRRAQFRWNNGTTPQPLTEGAVA